LEEAIAWRAEEEGLHEEPRAFAERLARAAWDHRRALDRLITQAAPNWPVHQIPPVNRNILRLALAELLFDRETPPKAVINEAVELAKTFGSETAPRFVNGVLGTIWGWVQERGEAELIGPLTRER
jgi:N utilization substance protein B